jgi:hypothetical protein
MAEVLNPVFNKVRVIIVSINEEIAIYVMYELGSRYIKQDISLK